jgi:hypothetical protein
MYVHKYSHIVSAIFLFLIKHEVSCEFLAKIPAINFTYPLRWGRHVPCSLTDKEDVANSLFFAWDHNYKDFLLLPKTDTLFKPDSLTKPAINRTACTVKSKEQV